MSSFKPNIDDILSRIKQIEGFKFFREIADMLDVSEITVSTWRKRQSIPYEKLMEYCMEKNIVLDWLLTGKGQMYKDGPGISASELLDQSAGISAAQKQENDMLRQELQRLQDLIFYFDQKIHQDVPHLLRDHPKKKKG